MLIIALEAYKKAFEQQLVKNKMEREANLVLASKQGGETSLHMQYLAVQRLANSLSETIGDKDVALSHMRQANRILGHRVRELEERFKIELHIDGDASPYAPLKRGDIASLRDLDTDGPATSSVSVPPSPGGVLPMGSPAGVGARKFSGASSSTSSSSTGVSTPGSGSRHARSTSTSVSSPSPPPSPGGSALPKPGTPASTTNGRR
jgi:hypothetical protein